MTPSNLSANMRRVEQLTSIRFVFHAWDNLKILTPDGPMVNLDTKRIDVDNDGLGGGIDHLKRLRLIPITTTTRPIINNVLGFAASPTLIGGTDQNGQAGLGHGLVGGGRTNVKEEFSYPSEKIDDLLATFGKLGLIAVNNLSANDERSERRAQEIFAVIMSGLSDRTILEDIPEYFSTRNFFLENKRPLGIEKTAEKLLEEAANTGLQIPDKVVMIGDGKSVNIGEKPIRLTATEYTIGLKLIEEIQTSLAFAEVAAIGADTHSTLPKTREGRQTGQKKSYDALDRWLMAQYPSFAMDTEIEKANNQMIRALENAAGGEPVSNGVPVELYLDEKKRNDELQKEVIENRIRLENLEKKLAA